MAEFSKKGFFMLIVLLLAVILTMPTNATEPTDPYELSLGSETKPKDQSDELSSLANTTPTYPIETSFAQAPDQTQYDSLSPQYSAPSPYARDDLLSSAYQYNSPPPYIEALAPEYEYSSPSPSPNGEEPLAPEYGSDNSLSPEYASPPHYIEAMAPEIEGDGFYSPLEAPVPAPEHEPEVSWHGNGGTLAGLIIGGVCIVGLGALVCKKRRDRKKRTQYKYLAKQEGVELF
ncbi:hypothetical protein ACB092_09G026200 [Castanea dentata]